MPALIRSINGEKPAFTIHVGDTRGSAETPCTERQYLAIRHQFMMFDHPLVYTPGDNEWTDCWEDHNQGPFNGGFDPEDRLQKIRRIFFDSGPSLGGQSLELARQADIDPRHKAFVENARWVYSDVLFMTLHVVGSNNGWVIGAGRADSEFNQRLEADRDWLKTNLAYAKARDIRAVVLAFHAEIDSELDQEELRKKPLKTARHELGVVDGFREIREEIRQFSLNLERPVLQIYGDAHTYKIIKPYSDTPEADVLRLQTFGDPQQRAVRVKVTFDSPELFDISPM